MGNKKNNQEKKNWEKMGVYVSALIGFLTIIYYVVEMKVDIGKLQVKVEHLEEKK
jgi:hypothetical protein